MTCIAHSPTGREVAARTVTLGAEARTTPSTAPEVRVRVKVRVRVGLGVRVMGER